MELSSLDDILKHCKWVGECAEWQLGLTSGGYAQAYVNKKTINVHRLSLQFATGVNPRHKYGLHKCDNPKCVNPEHLYWGTLKENAQDAIARKRNYWVKRTHCKNGHAYSADTTKTDSRKSRECIICRKHRNQYRNGWVTIMKNTESLEAQVLALRAEVERLTALDYSKEDARRKDELSALKQENERLKEAFSYIPKVPTQPYEKELARELMDLKQRSQKLEEENERLKNGKG